MTNQDFQAGQLVAYLDALRMLEDLQRECKKLTTEEAALLVAQHRIASAAVEATK